MLAITQFKQELNVAEAYKETSTDVRTVVNRGIKHDFHSLRFARFRGKC